MWTSVVTLSGLYIFIQSLWKDRTYFPLVAEAAACFHSDFLFVCFVL